MIKRFLIITLFHAIFTSIADIDISFMSLLNAPLVQLFNESIHEHYGVVVSDQGLATAQSLVASLLFIGILCGALLTGKFMDSMGRKAMGLYLKGILDIIAATAIILALSLKSIELFALSRLLAGISGALKVVLIIYLSECAPNESRGTVCLIMASAASIMPLIGQPLYLPQIFGNTQKWLIFPLITIVVRLCHLIIGSRFPDSPKHLHLNKHKEFEAKQSLMFYQGKSVNQEKVIQEYEHERLMLNSEEHLRLREIWSHPETKLPFIIICIASLVPATSGAAVLGQYLQKIFVDMNLTPSTANLSILIITYATAPFALLSPFLIEKLGRRPLFLTMSLLCTAEWAFLGVGQTISATNFGAPIGFVGIITGNASAMLGVLNMTTILINEICPFPAKAKTTEFVQLSPILVTFLGVFLYPPMIKAVGSTFYFLMTLINLSLFLLLFKFLPETRMSHVDSVVRTILLNEEKEKKEEERKTSDYGSIDWDFIRNEYY